MRAECTRARWRARLVGSSGAGIRRHHPGVRAADPDLDFVLSGPDPTRWEPDVAVTACVVTGLTPVDDCARNVAVLG
jgi:hypothetical protein